MSREYLQPPRGMRDIVGEEAQLYEYLLEEFRNVARIHGFKPVIPPTVEYYRLFEAKSGVEIKKTMYVFEDKAGRTLALRPEVTASITRIYLRLLRGESKPIRLYYVAQCFRYEEPQRARYREFWQGGLEVIGDPSLNGDVSVAFTASYFLDRVGVKHYYEVSNVALHRAFMKNFGIPGEEQDLILHLIDKRMTQQALEKISRYGDRAVEAMEKLLSTPLEKLSNLLREYSELFGEDYEYVLNEYERMLGFIDTLKQLGYNVVYEPNLVRGLAYYTGLIYEYKAVKGVRQSIGGGGRYDNLSMVYGGPPEHFTGLALGLDRVALSMESRVEHSLRDEVLIIIKDTVPLSYGYSILRMLSDNNVSGWVYRVKSIGKGLSLANKRGARIALIIGDREYRENLVTVKDMEKQEQVTINRDHLVETIIDILKKTKTK